MPASQITVHTRISYVVEDTKKRLASQDKADIILLLFTTLTRDGILGHQFYKRLESFAPCSSKSLLLADFKENHTLLLFLQSLQKTAKLENSSPFMISFVEQKNESRKPDKILSLRRLEFMPINWDKNAGQEFPLWCQSEEKVFKNPGFFAVVGTVYSPLITITPSTNTSTTTTWFPSL